MAGKAWISDEFATPNDVALKNGVSATRAAELREQVLALNVRRAGGSVGPVRLTVSREGSRERIKNAPRGRAKKK